MGRRMIDIPIASHSYQSRSKFAGAPRLVNLQRQTNPPDSNTPFTLLPVPGLKQWTTAGSGEVRGLIRMGVDLYAVIGSECHAITGGKVSERVAKDLPGSGPIHMAHSGVHVLVATPTKAYAINRTESVELAEGNFNGAAFQDGYGIFTQKNTQNIFVTNLDDMTTIDGADSTTKDALPDNVKGLISDHRQLIAFGTESSEFFSNIGDPEFPFARDSAGFMGRGILSEFSPAKSHDFVYFLGNDRRVYRIAGYRPQPISHAGIDLILSESQHPEDAVGMTFSYDGHDHYALSGTDFCVIFDITENRWHERVSPGLSRWLGRSTVDAFGKVLVGDYSTNIIYELDRDTYTDNGDAIANEIQFPVYGNGASRVFFEQLFLDFDVGRGLTTGDGSDPKAVVDWRDHPSAPWSNSREVSMGKKGEYHHRAILNQLGSSYRRTFRVRCPQPSRAVLVAARVKASGGL